MVVLGVDAGRGTDQPSDPGDATESREHKARVAGVLGRIEPGLLPKTPRDPYTGESSHVKAVFADLGAGIKAVKMRSPDGAGVYVVKDATGRTP